MDAEFADTESIQKGHRVVPFRKFFHKEYLKILHIQNMSMPYFR